MDTLAELRAGRLAGATRLDLSCGLTEFPREIFDLADSLETLNLSGNALDALPDDLGRLHAARAVLLGQPLHVAARIHRPVPWLDIVGFKANRIRSVPAAALPPSLRWLILTDNQIEELPDTLGHCTRMQKLMLAGNRLRRLPDSMAACRRSNCCASPPTASRRCPIGCSPCRASRGLRPPATPSIRKPKTRPSPRSRCRMSPGGLTLGKKLGEGASGVIHQATLGPSQQEVAVKLFKGAVTSDGWPHSEMAACIAAGAHPTLIAAQSRIDGHPDGTEGLVMALVPPSFRTLAGPPSLASCTRDVYADDAQWTSDVALRIAHDIASAMQHLHARGILHGDLYAHNILWNAQGGGRLGDFGAGWMTGSLDARQAAALQRLEMRAFGCLLEELLERCSDAPPAAMSALKDRCMHPDVSSRPSFAEALSVLQQEAAQ
jgi:hypothetical protein